MKEKEVTAEVEILDVIEHYWQPILAVVFAIIVVWGGYLAYGFYQNHAEKLAQEELFNIQKSVEKKTADLTQPDEKQDVKKPLPKKEIAKELPKTPEELKKDFSDALSQYQNFTDKYAGRKASYMAAVQWANLASTYKDFELAAKALGEVAPKIPTSDVFYGLVHSQLATALTELKKYPEAVTEYNKIIDSKDLSFFHAQALLRLSACYIEMGEFDKAQTALTRLEKDFPMTQAASEARNYKKLLVLKRSAKS